MRRLRKEQSRKSVDDQWHVWQKFPSHFICLFREYIMVIGIFFCFPSLLFYKGVGCSAILSHTATSGHLYIKTPWHYVLMTPWDHDTMREWLTWFLRVSETELWWEGECPRHQETEAEPCGEDHGEVRDVNLAMSSLTSNSLTLTLCLTLCLTLTTLQITGPHLVSLYTSCQSPVTWLPGGGGGLWV